MDSRTEAYNIQLSYACCCEIDFPVSRAALERQGGKYLLNNRDVGSSVMGGRLVGGMFVQHSAVVPQELAHYTQSTSTNPKEQSVLV